MIAANKEKAGAYISVSGIGERADKLLEKQIGKESKELADKSRIILDSLVMEDRNREFSAGPTYLTLHPITRLSVMTLDLSANSFDSLPICFSSNLSALSPMHDTEMYAPAFSLFAAIIPINDH